MDGRRGNLVDGGLREMDGEFGKTYVLAIVDMMVPGKRPRGRPRGRWMDCVRRDMQELRITPEDAQDKTFWKSRIRTADPN